MAMTEWLRANQLTQIAWDRYMHKVETLWMPFAQLMGPEGSGMPIIVKSELVSRPGVEIRCKQLQNLQNAGIGNNGTLHGNEEAGRIFNAPVVVAERGNAVWAEGEISLKMTDVGRSEFMSIFGNLLGQWAHDIALEPDITYALSGLGNQNTYVGQGTSSIETVNELAPSTYRIWRGGQDSSDAVTKVDTLAEIGDGSPAVASCYMGMAVIHRMNAVIQMARPIIRPVRFANGKSYWIWLMHPLQIAQLMADSNFRNQMKDAGPRDLMLNPLAGKMAMSPGTRNPKADERPFQGAVAIIDDFVICSWQRCESRVAGEVFDDSTDAVHANIVDGTYRVCRSLILGQEAGFLAWGKPWELFTEDFDYHRKPGVATTGIYGVRKGNYRDPGALQTTNTSQEDVGVYVVDTAAADLT